MSAAGTAAPAAGTAAAIAAAAAAASLPTPGSVPGVGPTRKTLFRKSGGDELLTAPEALDADEKQTDKALVAEMLSALREEVKEMDRTSWFYETQDPQISMRIKI